MVTETIFIVAETFFAYPSAKQKMTQRPMTIILQMTASSRNRMLSNSVTVQRDNAKDRN